MNVSNWQISVFIGIWAIFGGPTRAQDPPWKAGIARAKITPNGPIWMAGYAARTAPSQGVLQDLWAKALVLEDPAGKRVALITLDLCGISKPFSDEIRNDLAKRCGLDRGQVALACSHTHSAPVTRDNLITMYKLDDEQARLIAEYSKSLQSTILDIAGKAITDLQPSLLSWGTGRADFAVNRRENKEGDVPKLRQSLSLKGPNDFDVPVLVIRSADDSTLRGIVCGYACHCTTLSGQELSNDYAGFALSDLESRHPGVTAMFVAGCGADQNPIPRRETVLAREYGASLAASVTRALEGPLRRISGRLSANYLELDLKFDRLPTREEWQREAESPTIMVSQRAKAFLARLDSGDPTPASYPYPVQAWRLGDDLTWILLGGEVVVDYSLRLKRNLGPSNLWVSAYCNDVMAYIPSERVLAEGGYEGDTSMVPYGQPSKWAPGLEDQIIGAVRSLVSAPGTQPRGAR
ncbi:MAG: neutral/alkaline non-lysosomal ceramidase N-terminal domain-containing protein [Isosphaeraceae bacterium]